MTDIDEVLKERGKQYGEFPDHARISQGIKQAMKDSPNWCDLSDDKKEALTMIAHKIARILNGNPEYAENWRDIAGYSTLVVKELHKTEGATDGRVIQQKVVNGNLIDITE